MLYPYSYDDVMAQHRQVLKDADTYRRHFRTARPGRLTIALLTIAARVARRFAVRLEDTVESLRTRADSKPHPRAAA